MALDQTVSTWNMDFEGKLSSPSATIAVGGGEDRMEPYHLLFGALSSCFYATFLSIAKKKRLSFDQATVTVSGEKVEEGDVRPLRSVRIDLEIENPSNEKGLRRSAELGTKFCSIHHTIAQIAEMELNVSFK
jgi:putative redox protein